MEEIAVLAGGLREPLDFACELPHSVLERVDAAAFEALAHVLDDNGDAAHFTTIGQWAFAAA